jgi:CRISPR-associated protein Cas2
MTVLIANDTPPAIRGLLKRWFLEPKPNVFVGTVNARTREKTLAYIRRHGKGLGLLVIYDDESSQGFTVESSGDPDRRPERRCGLELIAESWDASPDAAPPPSSASAGPRNDFGIA